MIGIGDKKGYYEIQRKAGRQDVTMSLDNGLREKYFNLEYYTEDARINELLEYFRNSDPDYQTDNFPRIVERVNFFKVQKEGVNIMCEIADRIRNEGRQEGRQEGIKAGETMLASLLTMLFADGRAEDAKTAVRDKIVRNKFYKEYGIV